MSRWAGPLLTASLELGFLAIVWYFLGLDGYLVALLAGVIVAGALVPRRFSTLASGLGFAALALFVWLYAGNNRVAGLLCGVAGLLIFSGLASLKRPPPNPE